MSLALSTLDVSAIAEGLAAGSVPWDLGVADSPTDRRYEQIVGGRIVTTRLAAGDTLPLPERRVHGVTNRADLAATSVHVYAPPLRTMSFYRFDDDSLVVDRVEEVTT